MQCRVRGAGSAIGSGLGGSSNVWLAASQLETAVLLSLFGGTGLVLRVSGFCWTLGDDPFSEPACFWAALVLAGRAGLG